MDSKFLEKLVGVLLEHLDGEIVLTNEELENAPDVELRNLAATDEVEIRVVPREKTLWSK